MPVRTGKAYLEGLQDTREIWLGGERVADVTTHPALCRSAATLASLYDLQHDPAVHDLMTYPAPNSGAPVGRSFQPPYSQADLIARRRMMQVWANATHGMMGCTPDLLNVALMTFAIRHDVFAQGGTQYAEHIQRYYAFVRDQDLCLAHTLLNPHLKRCKAVAQQIDPELTMHKVGENAQGILVRGTRILATLAPYSDELLIYPSHCLEPHEDACALVFALPIATPGLRFICCGGFDRGGPIVDHPLAQFDEMDCVVIFDDVLVPWERVFVNANANLYNALLSSVGTLAHTGHQMAVRNMAKCEFIVGIAQRLVETSDSSGFLHIQEKMAELITYLETIKACVYAAESQAQPGPQGLWSPAMEPLYCTRNLFPTWYPRMVEILQLLGAGGFMMTTGQAAPQGVPQETIGRFGQGAQEKDSARLQLFRLAWDVVGEAIGARQELYERFFSGDPVRNLAARYRLYDVSTCVEHVERLLATIA